ncbi:Crp/Fnr family transcriptional regulator [Flavobacterium amnicola]|uniref:Crp/Fnr family transcriptional regulator n=1 Tax=Flavobacterium amnicola TaxID=2506422 RepID=A0A4Q1K2R5_9FLAO|nr:Crp/Fnr family transcriptional regulator [Flavobacterium amnicola]RXR19017.1 Crp/Fnr family transcriptional regulator [Flavobacterium amnicola]
MTNVSISFTEYLQTKAGITDEQLLQLNDAIQSKTIEKGSVLLRQGEICSHSFFLEKGLLRSYTIDAAGKEHIIQFASESWIISDRSSIFFNEPSDFYIDAVEDSTLILIDQNFINLACEISVSFRLFNDRALQNHIRHLQKRINLLLGASAEERYLDFIKLYPDMLLRAPQWMIASYLGITPESLSRVRKELAKRNFKPY